MSKQVIKGLGEVALRVSDLDAMQKFYAEVIGLPLLRRFEHATFFKIADGYGGHAQVLALFDRSGEPDYAGLSPTMTTVDHLAFEIDRADYESEQSRLAGLGLAVEAAEHTWVRWRSLYVRDPEGNLVELVCHDGSVA